MVDTVAKFNTIIHAQIMTQNQHNFYDTPSRTDTCLAWMWLAYTSMTYSASIIDGQDTTQERGPASKHTAQTGEPHCDHEAVVTTRHVQFLRLLVYIWCAYFMRNAGIEKHQKEAISCKTVYICNRTSTIHHPCMYYLCLTSWGLISQYGGGGSSYGSVGSIRAEGWKVMDFAPCKCKTELRLSLHLY